jgi:glycosyltransferase involved in cell wall biosynthesis
MDFWFLCRRISMLRSDGQLSTLPIDPATCARCLGEESRRYRWLGRLAPALANAFWHTQVDRQHLIQDRLAFLLGSLNQASAIISRSQFVRQTFITAGIAPERIRFIRQGRDFPDLTPAALVKSPAGQLRVGYLGQIAAHKGLHVLLEAARRLPEAALSVRAYGDTTPFPNYTARLRRLIDGDERLTLAGPYAGQAALRDLLRDLDVVVVPSLWYENSPNVILEAFAHGTPVIVSDLGGMAELVTDGVDGLRFPAGDAAALARCLRRFLDEPGLLDHLRAGIAPIKGVAQEMDELEAVYRQVVPLPSVREVA